MEFSYTSLKIQVVLLRKYFSPFMLCTPPAWELWKRQLKLFQEGTQSLIIKSCISPLLLGCVSGSHVAKRKPCSTLGDGCVGLLCLPPGVLAALGEGVCGLCAKTPSAECNVMSERVPIGWKGVDKQEQIYTLVSSLPRFPKPD